MSAVDPQDRARLLAVLIDGDNMPAKFASVIFEEVAKFGEASVRRVYGDFATDNMNGWSRVASDIGALPYHQPANIKGKNATDIGLVIDAMDLLHTGRFDGFVLVSSDSDFTRLASRIREQGLFVVGIGERKTAVTLVNAYNRFIYVENIDVKTDAAPDDGKKGAPLNDAAQKVDNALSDVEQEDGWAGLSALGSQLSKRYPDFDPRSYGSRNLKSLLEKLTHFEVVSEGRSPKVRRRPVKPARTRKAAK